MLPVSKPLLPALLAAGIAHAAIIAMLLRSVPAENLARPTTPDTVAAEIIDIELFANEPVTGEASSIRSAISRDTPSFERGPSAGGDAPHAPRRARLPREHDAVERVDDAELRAEPRTSATEPPAPKPLLSLEQLGVAGPNRLSFSTASTLAQHAGSAERQGDSGGTAERVVQSMRQMAHDYDRKLGLGAGGAVAGALQKATYASRVALDGRATFEIKVVGGIVSAVSLLDAEPRKRSAWTEVANNALTQLAARRVRSPPGSRGVVLRIEVVSRAALPSGHDPGLQVSVGPFVVKEGRGPRSAQLALLDLRPVVALAFGTDRPNGPMRLPDASAGVSLLRTDIDPVDVGAHARQVVHARTLDERLLE